MPQRKRNKNKLRIGSRSRSNYSRDFSTFNPKEQFKQLVELCTGESLALSLLRAKLEASSNEAIRAHGTGETLLHYVCSNERVTLQIVVYLVVLYPQALEHVATEPVFPLHPGMLPLHRACLNNSCPSEVVKYLMSMYPEALRISIVEPGLPLHCLLTRECCLDIGLVRMLVDGYPQAITNRDNELEETPLLVACARRDISLEIVQTLVGDDYEPMSLSNRSGLCPLHAILQKDADQYIPFEIVEYFLENAPNVIFMGDSSGYTPLHHACYYGNITIEIIQLLVENGGRDLLRLPTFGADGASLDLPLHLIARNEEIENEQIFMEIVEYIVQEFPNAIQRRNRNGKLPLHYICQQRQNKFNEVAKFLIRRYPHAVTVQDGSGSLPIHLASQNGSVGLVKFLFELYPDSVSTRTLSGNLPLHEAAFWEREDTAITRFLMEKYPDGLKTRNGNGDLPLHLICESRYDDDFALARDAFFAYPEAIVARNNQGFLPLHCALSKWMIRSQNLIPFLIEQLPFGMQMHDFEERLPTHLACGHHGISLDLLIRIVELYPDAVRVESSEHGLPIHAACKAGLGLDVIQYLESMYPESLDMCNESLGLPLECAKSQEIFMYLLEQRYSDVLRRILPLHAILHDDDLKNKTAVASRLIKFFPCRARDLDYHGSFPLHHAVSTDVELAFINKLIKLNPTAVEKQDFTGRLPLHYSLRRDPPLDVVERLLAEFRQGVSVTDHQGCSPLHVACQHEASLEVISLLTMAFHDGVRSRDRNGCVPLHVACRHGSSLDVVEHLIDRDETTMRSLDENNEMSLHKACRGGHVMLIQYLVKRNPLLAFERNRSGMLPVLVLSESSKKDQSSLDTPEYVETVWKLLLVHPECVMDGLN